MQNFCSLWFPAINSTTVSTELLYGITLVQVPCSVTNWTGMRTLFYSVAGPVFRDSLGGPVDLLFVADADGIAAVNRASGTCPGHVVPGAWTLYLQTYNKKRGIFFM